MFIVSVDWMRNKWVRRLTTDQIQTLFVFFVCLSGDLPLTRKKIMYIKYAIFDWRIGIWQSWANNANMDIIP